LARARDFRKREAAEVLQVDELRQARIEPRDLIQRVRQPLQLRGVRRLLSDLRTELCDLKTRASLDGLLAPGEVYEQPPHGARGVAEKCCAPGKSDFSPRSEVDVSLVNEGRGTHAQARKPTQLALCQPAQLRVGGGEELPLAMETGRLKHRSFPTPAPSAVESRAGSASSGKGVQASSATDPSLRKAR